MRNAARLFVGDVRRLGRNVVTVIIVMGLVLLPSIFSWYNILACWDVFDNTGNLRVAVANVDEGYKSDLIPLRVNVGDEVVDALRANDQLQWVITDEDDAIDGTESGRYYAAVVIPESFSADMMSFYEGGANATITYYSNQKKNAIAPRVTDQGADQVSEQVNTAFTQTIGEVALNIAKSMMDYADSGDLAGGMQQLGSRLTVASGQLDQTAGVLDSYAGLLGNAQAIVSGAGDLLGRAQGAADDASTQLGQAQGATDEVEGALGQATTALEAALASSSDSLEATAQAIDDAFSQAGTSAEDAAASLDAQADAVGEQASAYAAIASSLEGMRSGLGPVGQAALDQAISGISRVAGAQGQLADELRGAAAEVRAGTADLSERHSQAHALADQAVVDLDAVRADYTSDVVPVLDDLASSVASTTSALSQVADAVEGASGDVSGDTQSVSSQIDGTKEALGAAAAQLRQSSDDIDALVAQIAQAAASGDTDMLRSLLSTDTASLAEHLAAPVAVDRHAINPVANFGSAMSPLYTTLALWIGSLLVMVAFKYQPSEQTLAELDDPRPREVFLGRFGVVSLLSLAQSTVLALGNLLFLQVQVNSPGLYLICFWVAGLCISFINYTLVSTFANLGKAISVTLLVVQMAGGGGSFPLQLLPQSFQAVSPFLPLTHAVGAMRAAMFGVWQGDFWVHLGFLVLMTLPLFVLGVVLRGFILKHLVNPFVGHVEASKVM